MGFSMFASSFAKRVGGVVATAWVNLRRLSGWYDFRTEESAYFNPTILPNYQRLRSDFFRSCPKDDTLDACAKEDRQTISNLIQNLDVNQSLITRSELYTMESYLIAIASGDYLFQAYPGLQDRYRAIAGAEAYKRYDTRIRPDQKDRSVDTIKQIRADSLFLIGELRRLSIAIPRREEIRRSLLIEVLTISLLVASIVCGMLFIRTWWHFPYLLVVALFSLFGGVISVSRRLQSTPDEELNIAQWGRVSIWLSPLTSMGFGLVLYYIFAAQLITSPLFPDVTRIESACPTRCGVAECTSTSATSKGSSVLVRTSAPSNLPVVSSNGSQTPAAISKGFDSVSTCMWPSPLDLSTSGGRIWQWIKTFDFSQFSKLLVWAFIAGFAEQLVPDTLDNLISRQKLDGAKK